LEQKAMGSSSMIRGLVSFDIIDTCP